MIVSTRDIIEFIIFCICVVFLFMMHFYMINSYSPKPFITTTIHNYTDVLPMMETGDLILFGSDDYVGKIIRFLSDNYFTHSGIIFRFKDKVLFWECDVDNPSINYLTGKKNSGPHLIDLVEKIKNYGGNYASLHKLNRKIDNKKFLDIIKTYPTDNFNHNIFSWFLAQCKLDIYHNNNKIFCSELIASTYQKLGILHSKIKPYLCTPADILIGHKFQHPIFFTLPNK